MCCLQLGRQLLQWLQWENVELSRDLLTELTNQLTHQPDTILSLPVRPVSQQYQVAGHRSGIVSCAHARSHTCCATADRAGCVGNLA